MRLQWSWLLSMTALLGLPLMRGGMPELAQAGFACLCAGSLLLAPRAAYRDSLVLAAHACWLAWLSWLAVQLIPLPLGILEQISPGSAEVWMGLREAGLPVEHGSISVHPSEGLRAWVSSLALYALWMSIRAQVAASSALTRRSLLVLSAFGTLLAAYATFSLLGTFTLAILEPLGNVHSRDAHAPFANRNHLAAYLCLSGAIILAAMLGGSQSRRPQWHSPLRRLLEWGNQPVLLLRLGLLIVVIGIVLSRSRMGNVAFVFGLGAFALAWLLQTRSLRAFLKVALIFASIIAVDLLIVSERFGLERVTQRIELTDLDQNNRTEVHARNLQLLEQSWPFGAGLGSYSRIETSLGQTLGGSDYVYAHNDHAQLLIEAGLPGYAALVALVALHIGMALRRLQSKRTLHRALSAAALMGIAAATLHATVEFNAYIPAWRALFVCLLALLAGLPAPRSTTGPSRWSIRSRRF